MVRTQVPVSQGLLPPGPQTGLASPSQGLRHFLGSHPTVHSCRLSAFWRMGTHAGAEGRTLPLTESPSQELTCREWRVPEAGSLGPFGAPPPCTVWTLEGSLVVK